MELRELTYLAVAVRILAAVVLGGIIGLERELKSRPAGLRTYMLVCTGACLVMLTNQYACQVYGIGDPVRLGAQVVSGIGFLGAGTIIVTRRNQIKGLTTAAGLWSAAGVGLALGIGFYEAAVVGSVAIFVVMTLLQHMDNRMHRKSSRMGAYFELSRGITLGDFLRQAQQCQVEVRDIQQEGEASAESGVRAYVATLKAMDRAIIWKCWKLCRRYRESYTLKNCKLHTKRRSRLGIYTLQNGSFPAILRQKVTAGVSLAVTFHLVLQKNLSLGQHPIRK